VVPQKGLAGISVITRWLEQQEQQQQVASTIKVLLLNG
jgi:hypothetical protein